MCIRDRVIADEDRIARYSAEPVVCNGEVCSFRYVTPAAGKPVDLLLVAVKATVLEQAIQDLSLIHIYPRHCGVQRRGCQSLRLMRCGRHPYAV